MANVTILLGKSGTGKSTSLKGLDPKSTLVLNTLGKRLPFKGSNVSYNIENKNLFRVNTYQEVLNMLVNTNKSAPHIKTIILEDAIYIMRKEYFTRAGESGYKKYVELAQHFQQIVATCESMREDINVFLILHSEDVVTDGTIAEFKVSTIGKLLDTTYNPIEVVPMVLYSDVLFDDKGKASYGFYTNRIMKGGTIIPAKSPEGLFEEDFIPNDLSIVIKAMQEYYG